MIKKVEAMELLDDYTRWLNDRSLFQLSTSQVNGYLEDKEKREYKLEEENQKCPECKSDRTKEDNYGTCTCKDCGFRWM